MSSAFDRPGGAPEVPDTPDEVGAPERRTQERSDTWLSIDNESDEQLLSFLGLDRDDRAEPDVADFSPRQGPLERADKPHDVTEPEHMSEVEQPAGKSQAAKSPIATSDEASSWPALREKVPAAESQTGRAGSTGEVDKPDDSLRRQQALGKETAEGIDKEINRKIDKTVDDLNPKFDPTKTPYRENCTGVVQAYELQRREIDVQPGPLERHLRSDQGGLGGRSLSAIEQTWGRPFTPGAKADIETAFQEPGSRGVVYIQWNPQFGNGGHVFNVENVGGSVRFVDGQPTPAVHDASRYFNMGHGAMFLRLDDLPKPPDQATKPFLEP